MTWGWTARGEMPATTVGVGTVAGGGVGGKEEASRTQAWPRYEAEYLKRALQSDRYKYDTQGLDPEQKAVYLERVVADYKNEADQCLKSEFEQWLVGQHECNDGDMVYENADGKPVRRWVTRTNESEDIDGGSKVSQPRVGWKPTPWGRAPLTHLPGVREYFQTNALTAEKKDREMQLLAEYGPQNIDQAWGYFKHWVKGRPLTDAVTLRPKFEAQIDRTAFDMQPERMYHYDPEPSDRQPGVLASDDNAREAAVAAPGERAVTMTSEGEDRNVQDARKLREIMETRVADLNAADEIEERDEAAETRDELKQVAEESIARSERNAQMFRQENLSAPQLPVL